MHKTLAIFLNIILALCCCIVIITAHADVTDQAPPKSFHELVRAAKNYSLADKHQKAIVFYQQALTINPKAQELHLSLAWQLLWNKQFTLAKNHFEHYLQTYPNNASAKRGLIEANNPALFEARVLIKNKQYKNASKLLSRLMHIKDGPTLIEMAVVAGVADDHALSSQFYRKALEIHPKLEQKILLPYAWQLLWNKQYQQAEMMFNQYIKRHPGDKKARLGLLESRHPSVTRAHVFIRKRNFKQAIIHYKQAIKKSPNNATLFTWLGRSYAHDDQHALAAQAYKQALSLSHDTSLYLPIAQQLLWAYQADEAYNYFKLAKKHIKNKSELIYSGLLEAQAMKKDRKIFHLKHMLSEGHITAARTYVRHLLQIDPQNDAWIADIASVFSLLGYHEDSSELYRTAISVAPKAKYLHMAPLAWDYLWLEDYNNACEIITLLYKKDLLGDNVLNAMGFCLQAKFGPEKAINYYHQLIKKFPWKKMAWKLRIGQIYIEDNEYEKARIHFNHLLPVMPLNTKIIDSIGSTYNFSDQNLKALKHYRHYTNKLTWNNKLNTELTQTYYWLGLNKQAYNTIVKNIPFKNQPEHDLLDLIKRNANNRLYVYTSYSNDSNGLDISETSFELQHFLNDRTSIAPIFSFGYADQVIHKSWQRFGLELQTRYGDADTSYGMVWPSLSVGIGNYAGWNPFLWNSKVLWRINDYLSNRLFIGNEVVLPSLALDKQITYTSINNNLQLTYPNWRSQIVLQAGRFRDNNKRYLIDFDWLYRVFPRYYIYLGPSLIYYHNTSNELNNGYYNPKNYVELALLMKATFNLREFYISPFFKFGQYYAEDPEANTQFAFSSGIKVTRDIHLYHHLSLSLGYLGSGSNNFQGGQDYSQFIVEAGYHYYF